MGLAVVDRRAGTLVWIMNKSNGLWWPGRVLDPTEVSGFCIVRRSEEAPVKLLGRHDPGPEWFNLEKSRRIKAFRSEEFNECIRKVESDLAQYPKGTMKYSLREAAIHRALQLEEQMLKNFKKRKATVEKQAGIVCQAKRSRCVYLPAEKDCVSKCSPQSSLAKCGTSIKPTKSLSSKSGSYGPNTTQGTKLSAVDTLMATLLSQLSKHGGESNDTKAEQNRKSNGLLASPPRDITAASKYAEQNPKDTNAEQNPKSINSSKRPPRYVTAAKIWAQKEKIKRKQKISNVPNSLEPVLNVKSISKSSNGNHYNDKSRSSSELVTKSAGHVAAAKHLAQEKKMKRNQTTCNVANGSEPVINVKSFSKTRNGTNYNGRPRNPSELISKTVAKFVNNDITTLVDVEVTVQASSGGNHVPLVCLMSRLNGKAIIGYPINIEEASDFRLYEHEGGLKPFHNRHGITTALNVTWKKRRTSVCYVSQPQPLLGTDNVKTAKTHQGSGPVVASCVPLAKIFSKLLLPFNRV